MKYWMPWGKKTKPHKVNIMDWISYKQVVYIAAESYNTYQFTTKIKDKTEHE